MKGSKKAKNNNANSMNEAQLESVQGGVGMPAGWNPGDGARGKQIQPRGFGAKGKPIQPRANGVMTLEERDDWALYGRNK